jgi:histone chaperone ASF1
MAKVNICNVVVKDNPCPFRHPFQFEITFECIENLNEDLEWKIIYVGSAESEEYDQILDTVVVGPIIAGRHMFVFEADPPNPSRIPREDVLGVTVVLLTCSYRRQEFIRVGYYVNNEYNDPELKENPPQETDFDTLQRNILATCPRVTRFKIDWADAELAEGGTENVAPPTNTESESNQMMDMSDAVPSKQIFAPSSREDSSGYVAVGAVAGNGAVLTDSNHMITD